MTNSKQNLQKLFYRACQKGMLKLVIKCLEHGADLAADDNLAIQWASENGHAAVVKLLLEHGADLTVDDNYSLQMASYYGHAAVVEILKNWIENNKKAV